MTLLKSINLAVAFFLELTALGAFAYWGFQVGGDTILPFVLGIGTPVLGAVIWGIFAAPKSSRRLRGSAYLIFKVAFFAVAILALIVANSPILALILAVIFVINTLLIAVWHQEESVDAEHG